MAGAVSAARGMWLAHGSFHSNALVMVEALTHLSVME